LENIRRKLGYLRNPRFRSCGPSAGETATLHPLRTRPRFGAPPAPPTRAAQPAAAVTCEPPVIAITQWEAGCEYEFPLQVCGAEPCAAACLRVALQHACALHCSTPAHARFVALHCQCAAQPDRFVALDCQACAPVCSTARAAHQLSSYMHPADAAEHCACGSTPASAAAAGSSRTSHRMLQGSCVLHCLVRIAAAAWPSMRCSIANGSVPVAAGDQCERHACACR
jgi:hypothetical protein